MNKPRRRARSLHPGKSEPHAAARSAPTGVRSSFLSATRFSGTGARRRSPARPVGRCRSRRSQRLPAGNIGCHVPNADQDVDDREHVGGPARTADHMGHDHGRGEPRKRLEAIEVGAVGAHRLPDEVAGVIARPVRIEALDETERDIGKGRGDEDAPDGDGHERAPPRGPGRGVADNPHRLRRACQRTRSRLRNRRTFTPLESRRLTYSTASMSSPSDSGLSVGA